VAATTAAKAEDYCQAALLYLCVAVEPWAGWFVVAAFAAILVWEEVWDLPGHADLSGELHLNWCIAPHSFTCMAVQQAA
jgi:hypothetical protein